MSQFMNEVKDYIKDTRKSLKKILKENEAKPNQARQALINIYTKQLEEHELLLRDLKLRDRIEATGITYEDWWKWAQSLYSVHFCVNSGQHVVTSKARDWGEDTDMSWGFPDEISCKEKIEQLCGYKMYDRKRGRGDMDQDLKGK